MIRSIDIPHGGIPNLYTAHSLVEYLAKMGKDWPFVVTEHEDEAAWMASRKGHIGASAAATVLGMTDSWKTRRALFDELSGGEEDEFKGNELTEFGHRAEPLIRAMWALEHPDWICFDPTNLHFVSKTRPWQATSLDMVMFAPDGRILIGEIKTAIAHRGAWGEYAPDNYAVQCYHELAVTGFNGVVLLGRVRIPNGCLDYASREKAYVFDSADAQVAANIGYVTRKETEFWQSVESGAYKPVVNLDL